MSTRDTNIPPVLETWLGNDERIESSLLPPNKFLTSRGILFGLQGCAERITGKEAKVKLDDPILSIFQLKDQVFVQQIDSLSIMPVTDLD